MTLLPEFVSELVCKENVREQDKDDRVEQRQTNKINAMLEVANFGVANWKYLLEWNVSHSVLQPTDISFVNTAIAMEKGKFPSEKQCGVILKILEKARLEGFPK